MNESRICKNFYKENIYVRNCSLLCQEKDVNGVQCIALKQYDGKDLRTTEDAHYTHILCPMSLLCCRISIFTEEEREHIITQ